MAVALTWSRPWDQIGPMKVGAIAETAAHVELLVREGRLSREDGGTTLAALSDLSSGRH